MDEGYSEDTRSQSGSDMVFRNDSTMEEAMDQDPQQMLPDWFLSMSEEERTGTLSRQTGRVHVVTNLCP